ncbi:MAG TPA: hypothetical protein VFX49_17185, partial [Chloroflexota bacterium]|nr:hypothetical protein [Chloroflexota bacterium]
RRAAGDPPRAIVAWSPTAPPAAGPPPLRALPRAAVYVLQGESLTRAATRGDLERLFGEPLGDLSLPGLSTAHPAVEAAKAALRGLFPWR